MSRYPNMLNNMAKLITIEKTQNIAYKYTIFFPKLRTRNF